MFVSQAVADWYADCLDITEERGGDRRSFSDVEPVIAERFETEPPPECTSSDVADHVDHVRDVAGLENIGLGGDYDGSLWFPTGMGDVTGYRVLFDELRRRGWSTAELQLLGHGNVLRAMREMEEART
jgi:membrane dipeptidase